MTDLQIKKDKIDVDSAIQSVMSPSCGGIQVFIGTVRDVTKGKNVIKLEFEAYEEMAMKEISNIAEAMKKKWPVQNILIHHRIGTLHAGEVPVLIAVASAHRDAAFEACRFAIDTLKEKVPIWKKEIFEDGEVWVAAHP